MSTPIAAVRRVLRLGRMVLVVLVVGSTVLTGSASQELRDSEADSNGPIIFGMSTALSGPVSSLGVNMRAGVLAAFAEANRAGGINGRELRLLAVDDGYEPARTAINMRALIERDGVVGIIGNVGTPTAVAAIPIVNETKTPFFGALTGAGILRKTPPDRYVINYRASYAEETAAMVDALMEVGQYEPEEVAFFTQRDAYGDAGFFGGLAALKRHGLQGVADVAHGRYERNTLAVENALADILIHQPLPKAVILVGTYEPCAEFIKLAKANGLEALFLNVSFVGAAPLLNTLGEVGDGVIVTQVVPHFESALPIATEHRVALKALDTSLVPNFGSLEGYIVGRILCRALTTIHEVPTREGVIDALEALGTFDLGLGEPLHLDSNNHQACHHVWPTVLRGGQVLPFDWAELAPNGGGKVK